MNGIYVVLAAVLVVWLGVFFYLLGIDRKLNRIHREIGRHEG